MKLVILQLLSSPASSHYPQQQEKRLYLGLVRGSLADQKANT